MYICVYIYMCTNRDLLICRFIGAQKRKSTHGSSNKIKEDLAERSQTWQNVARTLHKTIVAGDSRMYMYTCLHNKYMYNYLFIYK